MELIDITLKDIVESYVMYRTQDYQTASPKGKRTIDERVQNFIAHTFADDERYSKCINLYNEKKVWRW